MRRLDEIIGSAVLREDELSDEFVDFLLFKIPVVPVP